MTMNMTDNELRDIFYLMHSTEESSTFWNKLGRVCIDEEFGEWVYDSNRTKKRYFIPEDITFKEFHQLVSQCEQEGTDKPLMERIKNNPLPPYPEMF